VDISLGLVPEGDKKTEGDFRTPEGSYQLTERNPASDFFLSILISYPDGNDHREADRLGLSPGGQIMIHGQPNNPVHSPDYYRWTDWTDGCVAVSNSNMRFFLSPNAFREPAAIRTSGAKVQTENQQEVYRRWAAHGATGSRCAH
jgi:murein L,D-transpeptidase YafK